MEEKPFEIQFDDGVIAGHAGGIGAVALMLHGGPAVPDYTGPLAAELHNLYSVFRYTQRGPGPSTVGEPYTIESHMADAIGILDAIGVEKAWAVGHSWGAHLALHLAVAHPERLHGIVCIDPLGASADVFPEFHENLRRGLADEQLARLEEINQLSEDEEATEEDLVEQMNILWPQYFVNPATAPKPLVTTRHVECVRGTNRSIHEHFELGTLAGGLPEVRMQALFVHGLKDPMPVRASVETAKLIPGAVVAKIPNTGHFPWIEQPGEVRRALGRLYAKL